ncbi:glycerophosphodiester phosphodiesterase family protein [Alkalimonas sp. NCh-2]|uniref:glycerophosphodiester phosphodiesterase n=1 Tax=Alkalimonas sp. NCh-2 TaxID=3144846 RepID=UPI0031F668B1
MQIIAHRGASGEFPENTLLAIAQAILQGADAIEVDVYAVEGELIVIHDPKLERTTNGNGTIYQHSLAYLRQLDAGEGEPIPTLWQVLELVQDRCWLNIELKGKDTAQPLLALLAKAEQELGLSLSDVLVSSFNHHLLLHLKQALPELRLGALTASLQLNYAQYVHDLGMYSVHCDLNFIDQQLVHDAHQLGLKVFVYTVDGLDDITEMQQLGVDGIFTNYPARSRVWAFEGG